MQNNKKISGTFGLFCSPVSAKSMARGLSFAEVFLPTDGPLLWLENRSDQGVIVVQPMDGQARRDLNNELSVRARVGYGGGELCAGNGWVYFVSADTGRLNRQPLMAGSTHPLTPSYGNAAAPALSPDGQWLAYVHTFEGRDVLAVVDSAGVFWPQILVSGDDFYMQPAWHPTGTSLAWIAWNHPNMPWDGTTLRLGALDFNNNLPSLRSIETIAGDEYTSVFQPVFSPDGRWLAYASDQSGWWQLYLFDLIERRHRQLTFAEAEHGLPAWVQGQRMFQFSPDNKTLYFIRNSQGVDTLWQVDITSGQEALLPLGKEYTSLSQISLAQVGGELRIAIIASGSQTPRRVITVALSGEAQVWARAYAEDVPPDAYSLAQTVKWQGSDGLPEEDSVNVHGLYYSPHNDRYSATGAPPLIVHIHGGPTSQAKNGFNPRAQFFATRGYAFLEVNYRGSSGFGREYRNLLRENWGIYDVQDAVSGARSLVEKGLADGSRLVIMGGSAGGFTVLKALEDYPGFFKAGICLYGVSNQFTLAAETHKFEAHYSDQLLGFLPQAAEVYRERSPIYFVDRIRDPIAIFQGEDDQVVPRKQSDEVVASLSRRGISHLYQLYPGEGHGFRKSETIEHFYKAVEGFLREYVLFG